MAEEAKKPIKHRKSKSLAADGYAPIYPDKMPEDVKRYCEWFKAAYGWNPFEPIQCRHCKKPVDLMEIYRCYDCKIPMHRDCCIIHCNEHKA